MGREIRAARPNGQVLAHAVFPEPGTPLDIWWTDANHDLVIPGLPERMRPPWLVETRRDDESWRVRMSRRVVPHWPRRALTQRDRRSFYPCVVAPAVEGVSRG